jgi:YidC/Oxa1 family membrane protein insertase
MITDWSGISCEFCYATGRPALFINTAMKVENPNWQKIDCVPVEISLRNRIGIAIDKDGLATVDKTVAELIEKTPEYKEKIDEAYGEHFFNIGRSARVGALYILGRLRDRQKQK